MNQILIYNFHTQKKYKYFFVFIFIICIIICTVSCFNYLNFMHKIQNNSIQSSSLLENFKITQLYLNCNPKISSLSHKMFDCISGTYVILDIIGFIKIPKLNLNYPISKTLTTNNLNLLPCKVCGPEINHLGNFCIAAHNFNNNLFFSNLFLLNIGDQIYLYDLYNNFKKYSVCSINEVEETNTNCLNTTNSHISEVTLITCNNYTKKRLIVIAKEEA